MWDMLRPAANRQGVTATLAVVRLLLGGIAGCFVLAAAYTSVLIVERQDALQQVSRYNGAWLTSQAVAELARLQQRIASHAVPDGGADQEEVELRFSILENRLGLLRRGEVGEFVAERPEFAATIVELAGAIESAQSLIATSGEPRSAAALLRLLAPLEPKLARLAAAANVQGADRVAEDQRQLSRLHWQFSGILLMLTLCGVGLLSLLLWHNRLLQRAHARQSALTSELRTQNQRFDAALNNMSQALCMVDVEQRLIVCNRRYMELFSLPQAVAVPRTPILDILRAIATEAADSFDLAEAIHDEQQALIRKRSAGYFSKEHRTGDAIAVSHQPMPDGGWIATYEDITERKRAEARIAYMAHHDALTGLANRVRLQERLDDALTSAANGAGDVGVLCLDLDGFKAVNDTLGHPVGDALLRAVAGRLSGLLRQGDMLGRFGGDEFAILQVQGAPQPSSAASLATRAVEALAEPFSLEGQRVIVGASIGIAIAPVDGLESATLLKHADLALYRAKKAGRGRYKFFEPSLHEEAQARRLLDLDLRRALAAGEFEMHYQPVIHVATRSVRGFEALLRWRHPERGLIPPSEFIPLAEEAGLIVPLGEFALRSACAEAGKWPSDLRIAVNLSPAQFYGTRIVDVVEEALADSCIDPRRLELEITEGVLLQESESTMTALHRLRSLGARIAMDDFGTGYSSLGYLRVFPFDKVKIDKSFVSDIHARADSEAIVKAVLGLCAELGITTTAEGVETESQLEILAAAGCTEVQGYLFDPPRPGADVAAMLSVSRFVGSQKIAT
jgi:diguanylate cyclase (GGDEF)-like protein